MLSTWLKLQTLVSIFIFVNSLVTQVQIQADKYIRDLSLEPTVQPVVMEATDDTGYQVKVEGNLVNIEPGDQTLEVEFGSFADYKMPETLEHLWGPINISKLPPGVYNSCRMASHTYVLQD